MGQGETSGDPQWVEAGSYKELLGRGVAEAGAVGHDVIDHGRGGLVGIGFFAPEL